MNLKKTFTIVVLAVGIFSTSFFLHTQFKNSQSQRMVFQPEAQMVDLGINVTQSENKHLVKNDIVDACENSKTYPCYADFYKKLVIKNSPKYAIEDMKVRAKNNNVIISNCHPLMHVIGRQAAQSYSTISEAFTKGDSYCWSGYYHGIMEGMVGKIPVKELPKKLDSICADVPGRESKNFNYFNCIHGLGHGIMALLEDEVFDSLAMCDNLTGDWEHESCYSGVFMQNIIDSTNVADTDNKVKYLKPQEPLYPCNVVGEQYKYQCYLGQTSYALQVNGYNYKKVFDMCIALDLPYRNICNQSMGRDITNAASHEKQKTMQDCALSANTDANTNCIIGAVKEIISYYHDDTQAKDFCAILDKSAMQICKDTTVSYYSLFK